jgi:hypothetical protein
VTIKLLFQALDPALLVGEGFVRYAQKDPASLYVYVRKQVSNSFSLIQSSTDKYHWVQVLLMWQASVLPAGGELGACPAPSIPIHDDVRFCTDSPMDLLWNKLAPLRSSSLLMITSSPSSVSCVFQMEKVEYCPLMYKFLNFDEIQLIYFFNFCLCFWCLLQDFIALSNIIQLFLYILI